MKPDATNHSGRHVLVVAKAFPPVIGGVESYSKEVASAYKALGAESVAVLTQATATSGKRSQYGCEILDVGRGGHLLVFLKFLRELWRQKRLGNLHYDLIHATTWKAAVPLLLLGYIQRTVITVHGREVRVVPFYVRPLMHYMLNAAGLLVGVSETALQGLRRSPGKKTLVAYNGISSYHCHRPEVRDKRGERLVVYTFCRLIERKNVFRALCAVHELLAKGHHNFVYRIAGDGPERKRLEAYVQQHALGAQVELLGHIEDAAIVANYAAADIFLHPQVTASNARDIEGFGLTIADAMSFGCAPIVGRDGGPADFIEDGTTGLVVDGTSIAAIADALKSLLTNASHRTMLAANAMRYARAELSWERHVRSIVTAHAGIAEQ